jgi:hypothetical protein
MLDDESDFRSGQAHKEDGHHVVSFVPSSSQQ